MLELVGLFGHLLSSQGEEEFNSEVKVLGSHGVKKEARHLDIHAQNVRSSENCPKQQIVCLSYVFCTKGRDHGYNGIWKSTDL